MRLIGIVCAAAIALIGCTSVQQSLSVNAPVEKSQSGTAPPESDERVSEGRVSAQGGEVVLSVEPDSLDGKGLPRYVIVNETDEVIGYGYPYVFSTKRGGIWREIKNHPRCVFILPLLTVQPGERSEAMEIGRCDKEGEAEIPLPGSYRIGKEVELADGSRVPISATFKVAPDP